jgi:hypothetical protein
LFDLFLHPSLEALDDEQNRNTVLGVEFERMDVGTGTSLIALMRKSEKNRNILM